MNALISTLISTSVKRDESTLDLYVDDDNSNHALPLRSLKNAVGLRNLTINFPSTFQQPLVHLRPFYDAVKAKLDIRELALMNVDDLGRVDEILESNKTIEKLAIQDLGGDAINRPSLNVGALCCLLNRGPLVELHFTTSGGLDYTNLVNSIPENSTLTSLTFSSCDLRKQAVEAICKAVQRSSMLSRLDLSNNSLTRACTRAIGDMLQESSITDLVLKHTNLEGKLEPICEALRKNSVLKNLDLTGNGLSTSSGLAIAAVLRENTTLTELHLSGNDMLLFDIVEALKLNTTLTSFESDYKADTGFDMDRLKQSLSQMLRCNSTLTTLSITYVAFDTAGALQAIVDEAALPRKYHDPALGVDPNHPVYSLHGKLEKIRHGKEADTAHRINATFERALGDNQALRVLDLSGSYLTHVRFEALGHALKNNKSLVCLLLCTKFAGETPPCHRFCDGLKANSTLKTIQYESIHPGNTRDVGAIAIARALAANVGLKKVTILANSFTIKFFHLLSAGVEQNTTVEALVLGVEELDERGALIFAGGLALSTSLKRLDVIARAINGETGLANALASNTSLEELNISVLFPDDQQLAAFANALKFNTSLKRLWLCIDVKSDGPGTQALMATYRDNPAQTCEIADASTGRSCPWFYYRLNQTGRHWWPDRTFPATLWPRALVLADMRSPPSCPDILFHFISTKPDMFRDCRRQG